MFCGAVRLRLSVGAGNHATRCAGPEGRLCIAVLCAALIVTPSAQAASGVAKACAADIKAQCADIKPGGGKLKDCVKTHYSDLSADCQVAIVRAAAFGR